MTASSQDKTSAASKLKKAIPSILDDCDRPACDDMMSKMQEMSASANPQAAATSQPQSSSPVQCPPTSGEIGKGSWNLLHSMAAWYPDDPTDKDRQQMTNFFTGFARFYPCTWCAKDFQENLVKKPVQTSSRKALCQWLCEQHNLVNDKLGKPLYPCDMKSLDERWRKSSKEECEKSGH